jgi:hypothetical protein
VIAEISDKVIVHMRSSRQQLRAAQRSAKKERSSLSKMRMLGELRSRREEVLADGTVEKSTLLRQIFSILKFIVRIFGWQYYVVRSREKKIQAGGDAVRCSRLGVPEEVG